MKKRAPVVLAFVIGVAFGGASCRSARAGTAVAIEQMDRVVHALERIAIALEKANR